MPELPEVEVVRRALEPVLTGRRLVSVAVTHPRTARRNLGARQVEERLAGRRVLSVGRRGKFLLIDLEGDLTWVLHLGMSGRVRVASPDEEMEPHTHLVVRTDRQEEVRFIDPRTFGFAAVYTPDERRAALSSIGRDALEDPPDAEELLERLAGRQAPIKALLLDQRLISGVGNIYADEALHRAGIHPQRPAGSLTVAEVRRLLESIRQVLLEGILHNGTSLNDLAYLLPDGRVGEFLDRLRVYGREDRPCLNCGTPLRRTVIAQRSAHFCPTCQR